MTAKNTNQSEPKLADLPLPADQDVTGGADAQPMQLLHSLQQMKNDTARGVISHIRV